MDREAGRFLGELNARSMAINNGLVNFIERPYIYNAIISVPAGNSASNMGTPSSPYALGIQPADFAIVKSSFYADNGTRAVNINMYRSEDGLPSIGIGSSSALLQTTKGFLPQYAPLQSIAGSGAFPYIWKPPEFIKANNIRTIALADRSGSATAYNVYLSFSGTQYIPASSALIKGPWNAIRPYPLCSDLITVGANAIVPFNLHVSNGDFVCRAILMKSTGSCLVDISYNSIMLTSGSLHSQNIGGETLNGTMPLVLTAQMDILNNSDIQVNVTDMSGASNDVQITFIGFYLN